jgi:hypothetical protein
MQPKVVTVCGMKFMYFEDEKPTFAKREVTVKAPTTPAQLAKDRAYQDEMRRG